MLQGSDTMPQATSAISEMLALILLLILFVPFNTQNVIHDMFFWLFPVMALVEKGIPFLQTMMNKRKA